MNENKINLPELTDTSLLRWRETLELFAEKMEIANALTQKK